MRMMRSLTHVGALAAPGLGINIAVGTVLDFDAVDDHGETVETHLGALAAGYGPADEAPAQPPQGEAVPDEIATEAVNEAPPIQTEIPAAPDAPPQE